MKSAPVLEKYCCLYSLFLINQILSWAQSKVI